MKKTYAFKGNKETCANLSAIVLVILCSLSFLQEKENWLLLKPHIYEEDSCLHSIENGHKDDTSSPSRRTRTRWIISLEDHKIGVAEGVSERNMIISDEQWIRLIHEGCSKKEIGYCLDNKKSLPYLRAIQGHSGGIPIKPEMIGCTIIPCDWKVCIFHKGIFFWCSINSGEWTNSGRKWKWQIPTCSLFTPLPHDN